MNHTTLARLTSATVMILAVAGPPLAYIGFRSPERTAHIEIEPDKLSGIVLIDRRITTPIDGSGVAFLNVRGVVTKDPVPDSVLVSIRPKQESDWYPQGTGYATHDRVFTGIAQLGNRQFPLSQQENYDFIIQANNEQVGTGTISARIEKTWTISSVAVIFYSIYASIIDIVVLAATLWFVQKPRAEPHRRTPGFAQSAWRWLTRRPIRDSSTVMTQGTGSTATESTATELSEAPSHDDKDAPPGSA
jgi:hypothetical protein